MFDTNLTREYDDAVQRWGINPRDVYDAGIAGAVCDDDTRQWLRAIGDRCDWSGLDRGRPGSVGRVGDALGGLGCETVEGCT